MNIELKDVDIEKIGNYIANFSGANSFPDVEYILRFWNRNKQWLYNDIFNKNLILEKEFQYEQSNSQIISNLYTLTKTDFYKNFQKFINYNCLKDNFWRLNCFLNHEYLANNKYDLQTFYITLPSGKPYKIQSGCKVIRTLKKLSEEFDIKGFEEFQKIHSIILNQKIISGTICLSIHPLDYMTMSDNDAGWDSCMSWVNEGEYRQGTIEMMNSPYVIVAYIKEENDYDFSEGWGKNIVWNSKKWRQLFIVHPDVIMGIKQYPYYNENLNVTILSWIRELMVNVGYNNFTKNYYNYTSSYRMQYFDEVTTSPLKLSFKSKYMYNDICRDVTTYMYVNKNIPAFFNLNFSGESECMECGKEITEKMIHEPGYLCCFECLDLYRCEECGDVFSNCDIIQTASGVYICPYCAEELDKCNNCGQGDFNLNEIELISEENINRIIYLCDDCYDYYSKYCYNNTINLDEVPEEIKEELENL